MCNHNVNENNTTISIDTKKFLGVFPRKYKGICKCCGKNFDYIKENGSYKEVV